jgi:branched-chain amino acid transport system ATP-binding protein
MNANDDLLSISDLVVRYGTLTAVQGISFGIRPGSTTAIVGTNGAGKSTLARSLAGLVRPASGHVHFDGQDVTGLPPYKIRRLGVVYLPEERGVSRSLSVLDNLRLATTLIKGRTEKQEAIEKAVALFPVLGSRLQQLARTLSGGEQQMLALARALTVRPKLLIVDEMSLGLAPKMVDAVFESLGEARAQGVTILLIEQFVHRALDFADECVILRQGSVAWSGRSSLARTEVSRQYFGTAAPVPNSVQ